MTRFVAFALLMTATASAADKPVPRAHSHNDYEHKRPLFDALECGFCSVEADIFSTKDGLLVAHTPLGLNPERTLQKLYLDPLQERIRTNGGTVYKGQPTFYLLIDVKTDAKASGAALAKVLAKYPKMLTTTSEGKTKWQAVTIVISGNCDREAMAAETVRYAAIDGRPKDLEGKESAETIPWVSASWTSQFGWKGIGKMPEADRTKMRDMVQKAHDQGRLVRFWAAPDNAESWEEQHAAGVDLINTDKLAELQTFLLAKKP